ncbi:MAG: hypothetical protein ACK5LP_10350 [Campylobacteraceae bacterium]
MKKTKAEHFFGEDYRQDEVFIKSLKDLKNNVKEHIEEIKTKLNTEEDKYSYFELLKMEKTFKDKK